MHLAQRVPLADRLAIKRPDSLISKWVTQDYTKGLLEDNSLSAKSPGTIVTCLKAYHQGYRQLTMEAIFPMLIHFLVPVTNRTYS